jgi:hypothetical protein
MVLRRPIPEAKPSEGHITLPLGILRRLPEARIYLNDVEAMFDHLSAHCAVTQIVGGETLAERVDDIRDMDRDERHALRLLTDGPPLQVDYARGFVFTTENSVRASQLLDAMNGFVQARRSWTQMFSLHRPFNYAKRGKLALLIALTLAIILDVSTGLFHGTLPNGKTVTIVALGWPQAIAAVGIVSLGIGMVAAGWTLDRHVGVEVVPIRIHERRFFRRQNTTTWVSGVVLGVAFLVVGALIGHFWT